MEHEAFSLVQQGRAAEGQLLLDSFEYHRDKQDYTKGMAAAMQHLEARLEETVLEKTSSMRKSIISVVVLTILALSTWVFLVLRLMRWRTLRLSAQEERRRAHEALRNTNQNLEAIITERTQEVQHKHDELHRLSSHLLAIEEKERVRLSTILHDELQQILVTAQLRLGASAGNMQGAESGELEEIAGLIRSGIQTTRSLSSTLNPTAQSDDLLSALRHLSIRHQNTMDLRVHLHVEEQLPQPSKATHQLLIRAASEMLFNITKHAQVQEAFLSLQVDDSGCFQLCVEDEGVGMPTTDLQEFSGMGLLSIHQRAQWLDGSLLIENRTPQGSTVCLTLPILAG